MLIVKLNDDDLDKSGGFVKIGNVASAIAKANGAENPQNAERKIFPRINAAVLLGKLTPLDPENLTPLPKDDYGNGIVPFAELTEWGHATKLFDFRISVSKRAEISKAPPPINPLRGSGSFSSVLRPKPNLSHPHWGKWKHTPEIELWEACALALDIDPGSMKRRPDNWMVPDVDIFLPESFPSDEIAGEFKNLMEIAKANKLQTIHFKINLAEFAAWCAPVVHDLTGRDIPTGLAELAKDATQAAEIVEAVSPTKEKAQQSKAAPVKLLTAQEDEILRIIREVLNFNPLKLEKPKAGISGVKAEVRKLLSIPTPTFQSDRVFEKAWQRLRDHSKISDK